MSEQFQLYKKYISLSNDEILKKKHQFLSSKTARPPRITFSLYNSYQL